MKMSEEIKILLKELYFRAYSQGYSDGEWERNFKEDDFVNEDIEEYIFNNNIYLFEDYAKS